MQRCLAFSYVVTIIYGYMGALYSVQRSEVRTRSRQSAVDTLTSEFFGDYHIKLLRSERMHNNYRCADVMLLCTRAYDTLHR